MPRKELQIIIRNIYIHDIGYLEVTDEMFDDLMNCGLMPRLKGQCVNFLSFYFRRREGWMPEPVCLC